MIDKPGDAFPWSDAWLLLALLYADEPADRKQIVEIGDCIMHAIMTDAELESGLTRLLAAGHVIETSGRFAVSPTVAAWFAAASPARSRILTDLDRVKRYLGIGVRRRRGR